MLTAPRYRDDDYYDDNVDDFSQQDPVNTPFPHYRKIKYTLIFILILMIYFYYDNIVHYFLNILKDNPTMYKYYLLIESEITNNTVRGLFFISILASLFFMVLPSEAIYLYYLTTTSFNVLTLITIIMAGTIVGLTFNYFFGWMLGERFLRPLFKKNFDKYSQRVEDWGDYVLVIGNILPGPIEVLAVFFGGFRFGYKRFILLTIIGRVLKYIILLIAFTYFWSDITMYYDTVVDGFLSIILLK